MTNVDTGKTNRNVGIMRGVDFYWVVVDGKPSYPCTTRNEAVEIAITLSGLPARHWT